MTGSPSIKKVQGELLPSLPARLQISLYNPRCSGEFLRALCDWLCESAISDVEFQIADSLQRHNLWWREKINWQDAFSRSIAAGDDWLDENQPVIHDACKNFASVKITRWDHWLNLPAYNSVLNIIEQIYSSDIEFGDVVSKEAEEYYLRSGRSIDSERKQSSIKFLLEEAAVSEASQLHSPANEIYPGRLFSIEDYLKGKNNLALRSVNQLYVEFD